MTSEKSIGCPLWSMKSRFEALKHGKFDKLNRANADAKISNYTTNINPDMYIMKQQQSVPILEDAHEVAQPSTVPSVSNSERIEALKQSGEPSFPEAVSVLYPYRYSEFNLDQAIDTPEESTGENSVYDQEQRVRPKKTEDNPLKKKKKKRPKKERALVDKPRKKEQDSPDWQIVNTKVGSIENPIKQNFMIEDDMFLGKSPKADDVIQGHINDCYFLALVNGILETDRNQLRTMMSLNDGTFTANFFRLDSSDPSGETWVPAPITIDASILTHDSYFGEQIKGARFRVTDDPKYSYWYSDVTDATLSIHQDAYYEGATWVPLLEKAYAKFAELYGPYGKGPPDEGKLNVMKDKGHTDFENGYELLNWGAPLECFHMFYGNGTKDTGYKHTSTLASDEGYVDTSTLSMLLSQSGAGLAENERCHLTASQSYSMSIERLVSHAKHLMTKTECIGLFPELYAIIEQLIATSPENKDGFKALASKIQLETNINKDAGFQVLLSDDYGGDFKRFFDLVLNLSGRSSKGARMILPDHAYSVLGSDIRNHNNEPLNITPQDLEVDPLPPVSTKFSTVTVRNPHGKNEINRTGDTEDSNNGVMTLNLDEFQRVFSMIQYGFVET